MILRIWRCTSINIHTYIAIGTFYVVMCCIYGNVGIEIKIM